ncbi:hypothetical protein [Actinomadura rudentiformis]|uniref:Uncharacterized protein n=1 Tax=Actinomadura rudentiformis TaxID=359158 RepID=A0A6H9YI55_9ACTN|nr:hypothetical protein [Actinomadura rudentiformis]KAB2344887.1 hypothetical protein F8566_30320 [Actinomadura rudentiformis]
MGMLRTARPRNAVRSRPRTAVACLVTLTCCAAGTVPAAEATAATAPQSASFTVSMWEGNKFYVDVKGGKVRFDKNEILVYGATVERAMCQSFFFFGYDLYLRARPRRAQGPQPDWSKPEKGTMCTGSGAVDPDLNSIKVPWDKDDKNLTHLQIQVYVASPVNSYVSSHEQEARCPINAGAESNNCQ